MLHIYIYDNSSLRVNDLTLILLTWRKWSAPNNASRQQMGFNSGFKGLSEISRCSQNKGMVEYREENQGSDGKAIIKVGRDCFRVHLSIYIFKIFFKIWRRVYHSLSVTYLEQSSKERKCVEWKFSAVKLCTSDDEVVFVVL